MACESVCSAQAPTQTLTGCDRQRLADQQAGSVPWVCSERDANSNLRKVLLQPHVQQGGSSDTAQYKRNNAKEQREIRQEPL